MAEIHTTEPRRVALQRAIDDLRAAADDALDAVVVHGPVLHGQDRSRPDCAQCVSSARDRRPSESQAMADRSNRPVQQIIDTLLRTIDLRSR